MTDLEYAANMLLALLIDSENEGVEDAQLDIELRVLSEHLHHFLTKCSNGTPNYDSFRGNPVRWAKKPY